MEGSESYEGQFDDLDRIEDLVEYMKQFSGGGEPGQVPTWLVEYQTHLQTIGNIDEDLPAPITEMVTRLVHQIGLSSEISPQAKVCQGECGTHDADDPHVDHGGRISVTMDARSWACIAMFLVSHGRGMAQASTQGLGQMTLQAGGVAGALPITWLQDGATYADEAPGEPQPVKPDEEAYNFGTGMAAIALIIRAALDGQPGAVYAT